MRGIDTVEAGYPKYVRPGEVDATAGGPVPEGRVYLSMTHPRLGTAAQYFDGVAPTAWDLTVGGFEPSSEWLKDRRGVRLTGADFEHYQLVVAAAEETVVVQLAIDAAVDSRGGWPIG